MVTFINGQYNATNMEWTPVFYTTEDGNQPVKDFILAQPNGSIAEILHVFKLLREFNITLGRPYVEKVDKSGIRALRIKHGSDIYRIFSLPIQGASLCYSMLY